MDTHNAVHAQGAALLVMATFAMVGCGDVEQTEPSLDDIAPASNAVSGFCQEYMTADSAVGLALAGSGDPQAARDAFTVAVASAPGEISVAVETLASKVENVFGGQSSGPSDDQFETSMNDVNRWIANNCGLDRLEFTAFDYGYRSMPNDVVTGPYVVTLANEGAEFHEIQLVRINDGVTESIHQILELPEAEQLERITPLTGLLAAPGDIGLQVVTLDRPGLYAVVCLLTAGWTPNAEQDGTQAAGSPHWAHGMVAEFTVE